MSQCALSRTRLATESARVKSVTFLPDNKAASNNTRLLATLYSGDAELWQIPASSQNDASSPIFLEARFSISSSPLRSGTFIGGQNSDQTRVCFACDDGSVYVTRDPLPPLTTNFINNADLTKNGSTDKKMQHVEVGRKLCYVRSVAPHPLKNGFFTASDDGEIQMFIYDSISDEYICEKSHSKHFLMAMQVAVAPMGSQKQLRVCSVSQDMKIVFWFPDTDQFKIYDDKHLAGINCVAFHPDPAQPLLLTGDDGCTVNLWNYSNDTILKKFTNFGAPITSVAFSLSQPLILAASEDNTIRAFKVKNFKEVMTFNSEKEKVTNRQAMGRAWSISETKSGIFAAGYDNGLHVYDFTKSNTHCQMDSRLKMFYCQGKQIMQQNLSAVKGHSSHDLNNLASKSIGVCEYDEIEGMSLSSNGKYLAICSHDHQFTVYSSLALRNQISGKSDLCPVFASNSDLLFTMQGKKMVTHANNFKTTNEISLDFKPQNMFAGSLIGLVNSENGETCFFNQNETPHKVCTIPLEITNIFWNKLGDLAIANTESKSFLISINLDLVDSENSTKCFKIIEKFASPITSCLFTANYLLIVIKNSMDCLYFVDGSDLSKFEHTQILQFVEGNLLYFLSDEIVATLEFDNADCPIYRVYEINFDLLKFKQNVLTHEVDMCMQLFKTLSVDQKENALNFLEKHQKLDIVYDLLDDKMQKSEIALKLNKLEDALDLSTSESQYEKILLKAIEEKRNDMALKVIERSKNKNLSLQLLLILSGSSGQSENPNKTKQLEAFSNTALSSGQSNLSFLANIHSGNAHAALDNLTAQGMHAEAAFFARTYLPEKKTECATKWKSHLTSTGNKKAAEMILIPDE